LFKEADEEDLNYDYDFRFLTEEDAKKREKTHSGSKLEIFLILILRTLRRSMTI